MEDYQKKKQALLRKRENWMRERRNALLREKVTKDHKSKGIDQSSNLFNDFGSSSSSSSSSPTSGLMLDEITNALEEQLRVEIKREVKREQAIENFETRSRYTQMNNKLVEEISNHNCPICLELMRSPVVVFPCGHTFCDVCLKTMIIKHKNKKCPQCRAVIRSQAVNISLKQVISSYVEEEDRVRREMGKLRQSQEKEEKELSSVIDDELESDAKFLQEIKQKSEGDTTARHLSEFRKCQMRLNILESQRSRIDEETSKIGQKERNFDHQILDLQKEEQAIHYDMEVLLTNLENIQEQIKKIQTSKEKMKKERMDVKKKMELLDLAIEELQLKKRKSKVFLQHCSIDVDRLENM